MPVVVTSGDRFTGETIPRGSYAQEAEFGDTFAKHFPPYVFSVFKHACLIHRVVAVRLIWWGIDWEVLRRFSKPHLRAETVCGASFMLKGARSRTCWVPNPEAELCGRCDGALASFGKNGRATLAGIKRQDAAVKLGCVVQAY